MDPASIAAYVSAATPIILAVMDFIKPDMDKETVESIQERPAPEDIGVEPPPPITDAEGNTIEQQDDGTIKITDAQGNVTITDAEGNIISGGLKAGLSMPAKVALGVGGALILGGIAVGIARLIKMRKAAA